MKTILDLSKQYRREKASLKKLADKKAVLAQQIQSLQDQERSVRKTLNSLKTLIDFCIETGQSPVEAQLKNTPDEILSHMNQLTIDEYSLTDTVYHSQGLNITSSGLNSISSGLYSLPAANTVTLNTGGNITFNNSGLTKINSSSTP